MGRKFKRFSMNSAGVLLACKIFHNIALKFPDNMNPFLTLNHARSVRSDTNDNDGTILEADDILKGYIARFPLCLAKEIFFRESVKEPSGKCTSDSLSKAIVLSNELNHTEKTLNWNDLEIILTQLIYIALQFYFFGSTTKNIGTIRALTYESDSLFLEPKEILELEVFEPEPVSCKCPSIFGYIIPIEFFGSLLGLEPCCGRRYVHTSYSDFQERREVNESEDTEQCSLLKPIGYEVKSRAKKIAANMPVDKLSGTEKVCHQVNNPKSNVLESALFEGRNCLIQVSADFEIVPDDGAHPLLDCPEPEEDVKISKGLEDFLAHAFSEKETEVILNVSNERKMCNPPCSVWCDSSNARGHKAPHISYERSLDLCSNYGIFKRNLDLIKPIYAKNVSTNDPQYLGYDDILFDSENFQLPQIAIKELSTVREDPANLKVQRNKGIVTRSLSSKHQQGKYCNVFDQGIFRHHTYLRQNNKRSTWSFVEDKNSLWQCLPDCIPTDQVPKELPQKRTRDLRRQKSLT